MFFRTLQLLPAVIFVLSVTGLSGVVREADLLVRWTFDEGNGTIASDSAGGGVDARLSSNTLWGAGKSRGGLDLSAGTGYADAGPHPNLHGIQPLVITSQEYAQERGYCHRNEHIDRSFLGTKASPSKRNSKRMKASLKVGFL